jgi:transcriptional regulator with XRE-family HTH domain
MEDAGGNVDSELGKRLKAARAYGSLSQMELSRKLGISSATLIRYEKGRAEVPPLARRELAMRVSDLTGFNREWLLEAAALRCG